MIATHIASLDQVLSTLWRESNVAKKNTLPGIGADTFLLH